MIMTEVYIREHETFKRVRITAKTKPQITKEVVSKWQGILDATADILEVPAGLLMRITEKHMEVFVKSGNEANPYERYGKDTLGHGLYCETVIAENKPLHIENALNTVKWKDNPDVKLNMINYYGLPINWPDGEAFGTICVLDSKRRTFSDRHQALLKLFKSSIETDLHNLVLIDQYKTLASTDPLTGIPNRRSILEQLEQACFAHREKTEPFTVVMLDINKLKHINDTHGHDVGDDIIKALASLLQKRLRKPDRIGRIGGDEFLVILKDTDAQGAFAVMRDLKEAVQKHRLLHKHDVDFAYGVAEVTSKDATVKQLMKEADRAMLRRKRES